MATPPSRTSIAPGIVTLAFWVGQAVLDGKHVPKDITIPYLSIDQAQLASAVASTPQGGVANKLYSQADTEALIAHAH